MTTSETPRVTRWAALVLLTLPYYSAPGPRSAAIRHTDGIATIVGPGETVRVTVQANAQCEMLSDAVDPRVPPTATRTLVRSCTSFADWRISQGG